MNNLYSTEDFYLAAYLVVLGNKIDDAVREGNHTVFFFKYNNLLKKAVDKFYSMQTSIDALSYGSAIRSVKSMIHALKSAHTTSNPRIINNANNNKRGTESV